MCLLFFVFLSGWSWFSIRRFLVHLASFNATSARLLLVRVATSFQRLPIFGYFGCWDLSAVLRQNARALGRYTVVGPWYGSILESPSHSQTGSIWTLNASVAVDAFRCAVLLPPPHTPVIITIVCFCLRCLSIVRRSGLRVLLCSLFWCCYCFHQPSLSSLNYLTATGLYFVLPYLYTPMDRLAGGRAVARSILRRFSVDQIWHQPPKPRKERKWVRKKGFTLQEKETVQKSTNTHTHTSARLEKKHETGSVVPRMQDE